MKVNVKGYGRLRVREAANCTVELQPGTCVVDLMGSLGLPPLHLWLIIVDGRSADILTELHDGDYVGLVPPIGGG